MKMIDCPHFIKCSAPICPLSKRSINNCAWIANEPICKLVKVREKNLWIFKQKKLNRKITDNHLDHGLFTVEMLERLKRITQQTTGLLDIKKKLMYRTWIHEHPKTTKSLKQIARDLKLAKGAAEAAAKYRLRREKTVSN